MMRYAVAYLNDVLDSKSVSSPRKRLFHAKLLQFSSSMGNVGWTRFQNNFYLERGLSLEMIGKLKGIGLVMKAVGEPIFSVVADMTDHTIIYAICMIMGILTLEVLRLSSPLTYDTILWVKVARITVSPAATLTTTATIALLQGTVEGFGQQRSFGSLAWGTGAFLVGYAIDACGIDALFYVSYFFNFVSLLVIFYVLPYTKTRGGSKNHASPPDSSEEDEEALLGDRDRDNEIGLKNNDKQKQKQIEKGEKEQDRVTNILSSSSSSSSLTSYFRSFCIFLSRPAIRLLLINTMVYGLIMQVHDTFLYLVIERDLHASRTFGM
jgi:hypothetical protein